METTNKLNGKIYILDSPFGKKIKVQLVTNSYRNNGTLAVSLFCQPSEGEIEDEAFCDPYTTVTVNLTESAILDKDMQFVDENNNPDIGKFLVKNKIATPTGLKTPSGYCIYEAYKFNL